MRAWAFVSILVLFTQVAAANTFQSDRRRELVETGGPWTSVGTLWLPVRGYCTASLVGPDLILTNAHCVSKNGQLIKGDYEFWLRRSESSAIAKAKITYFWVGGVYEENRADDWALLKIDWPMGDKYGWLEVANVSDAELPNLRPEQATMMGYSDDFYNGKRPAVQAGCRFYPSLYGYILHDCSGVIGASGSPIFYGNGQLLALHAADLRKGAPASLRGIPFSEDYGNVAIPASRFYRKLSELRGLGSVVGLTSDEL